ncbi:MAG: ribosome rescue GTPase HflX [Wenzhouxiangellaceae bacterium]|nr:ribosome rescue GTPase HflX [Wenzhouxiangellaceae bacterium]
MTDTTALAVGERTDANCAILVQPEFGRPVSMRETEEFLSLAHAADCSVGAIVRAPRSRPDARTLVGSGKVQELREAIEQHDATLVLFNHRLSPVQERNLTTELKVPILDRTTLILDIFAQRARSHEGKLQVELAQLKHLSTRLVRGWTHLERQRGGIGMRGPGETQLETDRRLLAGRIRQLKVRLDRLEQHRLRGRQARDRSSLPLIALVGYTNAGKSTLFNRLTSARMIARDQLFATLDPTVRRIDSEDGGTLLASDTVGFIQDLPHELIAAFRATLEETLGASLVLQIVDAADPEREIQINTVEQVLTEIGAAELPRLVVYNKIDAVNLEARIERDDSGCAVRAWVSAETGAGVDDLLRAISERVGGGRIRGWFQLPARLQKLRSSLFDMGAVEAEQVDDHGASRLKIDLTRRDARELGRLGGADGTWIHEHLLK